MPKTIYKTEDGVDFQSEDDAKLHETVAARMGSLKEHYFEQAKIGRIRGYLQGPPGSILLEGTWMIRYYRSWEDTRQEEYKSFPPLVQVFKGRLIDVLVAVAKNGYLRYGGDFWRHDPQQVSSWEQSVR